MEDTPAIGACEMPQALDTPVVAQGIAATSLSTRMTRMKLASRVLGRATSISSVSSGRRFSCRVEGAGDGAVGGAVPAAGDAGKRAIHGRPSSMD